VSRAARLAIAVAWGFVVAVALYGIVRVVQFFLFPEPNPATVVWSAHAGYFWRVCIVVYGGGIASFVVHLAGARDPGRVARALVPALGVAAALVTLQGLFVP
jgi:hypothetical protein